MENDVQVSEKSTSNIEEEDEVIETTDTVVVRPENLRDMDGKGFEILNQSKSIITYDIDFNTIVALMIEKQATNQNKYRNLTTKTVFLVDESEFEMIVDVMNDKNQGTK